MYGITYQLIVYMLDSVNMFKNKIFLHINRCVL